MYSIYQLYKRYCNIKLTYLPLQCILEYKSDGKLLEWIELGCYYYHLLSPNLSVKKWIFVKKKNQLCYVHINIILINWQTPCIKWNQFAKRLLYAQYFFLPPPCEIRKTVQIHTRTMKPEKAQST